MTCQERYCTREATGAAVINLETPNGSTITFDQAVCEPCRLRLEDALRLLRDIEDRRDYLRIQLAEAEGTLNSLLRGATP